MTDNSFFSTLAQKLGEALPGNMQAAKSDIEQNFRAILQANFSKLDLVTREEFDAQVKVLKRTREKLEALEKKIEASEG